MIDLDDTYRRLARSWTHDQLAACYQQAARRGAGALDTAQGDDLTRPIALLATAIPSSATLSVAIHVLHIIPKLANEDLAAQLITTAETHAAYAIHRCHRALELDGAARGYTTDEWLPVVGATAAPLLESARLDQEPPSVVQYTQDAVRWLSHAIVNTDEKSPETSAAIADVLARLLVIFVFARTAER